jgi:hypothetical protein
MNSIFKSVNTVKIMSTPTIKINSVLPEIGIPFDPIILFFQGKVLLSYQLPLSTGNGKFGILIFTPIEFKVTPINDEGIGKHKFAKYGLRWYSIHHEC